MSAVLGPIHQWLFNKIKLVENREITLCAALVKQYGPEVQELSIANRKNYGEYYDDTPLEELVGSEPIHQFLSGEIAKVETREAAFIALLSKKYGDDIKELAFESARAHGKAFGTAQTADVDTEDASADDVYRAVKNAFLDGMPCDHVVEVVHSSDTELTELHTDCLHRKYWKDAGADEHTICEYISKWIDGIVEGIGGGAAHERVKTLLSGSTQCEDLFKTN